MSSKDAEATEIEIKLEGEAARLENAFTSFGGIQARGVKLVSHYYDTQQGELSRRGLSLRIRKEGRKQEMTLKSKGASSLARGEWTVALAAVDPDPDLLPDAARELLAGIDKGALKRQHGTEVMRRIRLLERNGTQIECALDIGRIMAGGRDVPVAEIEFELKSGKVDDLLVEVEDALDHHRLGFLATSKSERGVALATGIRSRPAKASPAAFAPGERLGQALAAFVASTVEHAIGNTEAIKDGSDPEGVHQMRVALRRLRSAFGLFRDGLSPLAQQADGLARELLKTLGRVRDLDVFIAETLPAISHAFPEELKPAGEALERLAILQRRDGQAAAREIVAGPVAARLFVRLMRLALTPELLIHDGDRPVGEIAPALLARRHARALKKGKGYERLPWESRHEVRIAVKKLRYALDFLAPVFAERHSKRFARRLSRLQDDMGLANDAHVAQDLALALAGADPDARAAAAFVCGWQRQALLHGEKELLDAWREFRKQKPFWKN